jgi:hypothetical protein
MNKWLELLIGLVLVIVGILVWAYFWGPAAILFLEGAIVWFVIGLGALFILLGISDLKG